LIGGLDLVIGWIDDIAVTGELSRRIAMMNVAGTLPDYLTLEQFCHHSGLSESTIRRRARDGSLPVVQIGGKGKRLLFPADSLERVQAAPFSTMSDKVESSSLTSSTVVSTTTPAGPRPRWTQNLPRHPK
jgi:hypothetical protein